jgi:hypothetical protein
MSEEMGPIERFRHFSAVYLEALKEAVEENPNDYRWYPNTPIEVVHGRMMTAVSEGSFNKESAGFRKACKKLGIRHTYKSINLYLNRGEKL